MAVIETSPRSLIVHIEGADRLWALKSRLEVPLEHVVSAAPAKERVKAWLGLRLVGAHIPGVIAAGTFHQHGETVFWDVHHADRAVEIELRDERYARLVIEVDDPQATLSSIRAALAASAGLPNA